jgi:3-hydroxyisobutyrate dehydrogenase-like beta-hydroxyacid dehydrogenase
MPEIADEFPGIALVGFGEAGHAFASGWARPQAGRPKAYDLKLRDAEASVAVRERCADAGVEPVDESGAAIEGAGLIFSVVTADQALEAARACAPHLAPNSLWLDCNSCAPQTKQQAAELIEAAGGRYVDVAVMAPVYPKRHEVPLLLAGPNAAQAAVLIKRLGMRPSVSGPKVGDASSIKMLRSVMIKGLEALTTECLLAARRAGVEDAVLASLQASDPGIDWRARGSYNLERMMVHGARRAAEVEEVCATLRGLGLPDWMSRGTVEWQRLVSSLGIDPGEDDLARRSDAILDKL